MFDDIDDNPVGKAESYYTKNTTDRESLEAYVDLEDILATRDHLEILGRHVDAMVDVRIVQLGSDDLYVESLDIKNNKIIVNNVMVDARSFGDTFYDMLIAKLELIAVDIAADTPEKYWSYR